MADHPSVRESLEATMASLKDTETDPLTPEPETGAAPDAGDAPEPKATSAPADPLAAKAAEIEPDANGRLRDPTGKFAPKTAPDPNTSEGAKPADAAAPTEDQKSEPATPAPTEAQGTEPIRVPPSLPAAVKAKFATLDKDVQAAFTKLEDSVQTSKAEWGKKGERLNRFDEILGPRREQLAIRGIDEFQAIQTLFAAQDLLDRNPVNGLLELARSYGVAPAQLAQALGQSPSGGHFQGGPGQSNPGAVPDLASALKPVLEPLQRQVQTLQQQIESEKQTSAQSMVEEFASRSENMYFENVREDVAVLIETGRAKTLQDAYDMACWMNPEIRELRQAETVKAASDAAARAQAEAAKKAEAAAREKARSAATAAGSVTGAPAPGAQAPAGPPGSVRDTLVAAMREHGMQV
jgi:hypothetical protein